MGRQFVGRMFVRSATCGSRSLCNFRVGKNRVPPGQASFLRARGAASGWRNLDCHAPYVFGVHDAFPAVALSGVSNSHHHPHRLVLSVSLGLNHVQTTKGNRMKIETQAHRAFADLCDLIEQIPVAMLTNVDAEGKLVGRPMSPIEMDRHGAVWFFIDLRHAKVEHMGPSNLSFADPDRAIFISMSGQGQIHTDRARIVQLWTLVVRPWFPDGVDSEHLALLKFVPESAEYWDAPRSKMIRMVALAVSVIAGKPIAQGEHDVLPEMSRRLTIKSQPWLSDGEAIRTRAARALAAHQDLSHSIVGSVPIAVAARDE